MARHYSLVFGRFYRYGGARYRVRRWPMLPPAHQRRLLAWFKENQASWPWRKQGVTPYGRLVAEMLLRQTTARQVAQVWPELVQRYPDPAAMAVAATAELEALLRPMGLGRQRTTALQGSAQYLLDHFGGAVPPNMHGLEQVPHVGPYAANAVRSFAFGIPVPIVDANVLRVFSRYLGRRSLTKNPHREQWIWRQATQALPPDQVPAFNYALLDLAHQVCRIRKPACRVCPVSAGCQWHRSTGGTHG